MEKVVFETTGEAYTYASGKCMVLETEELNMEIMDLTSNEEPPTYEWEAGAIYRVTVSRVKEV